MMDLEAFLFGVWAETCFTVAFWHIYKLGKKAGAKP